jgi:hypothetical protein
MACSQEKRRRADADGDNTPFILGGWILLRIDRECLEKVEEKLVVLGKRHFSDTFMQELQLRCGQFLATHTNRENMRINTIGARATFA